MATAQKILIDAQNTGLWRKVKQTDEAAAKVTELLQEDLEKHHVFFNDDGFHNHIVHHLLSLYGTGANATHIQKGFDDNAGYQRTSKTPSQRVIEDLQTWDHAGKYTGEGQYYPDFLVFFQREISNKGWEAVVSEYLFAGTGVADDLLVRLFAGLLHPLIQLMFGMEWGQPAIVAEALAQACVHPADYQEVLYAAEKEADEEYGGAGGSRKMPSIVSLLEEVRSGLGLAVADSNGSQDLAHMSVSAEVRRAMGRVKVRPEELEEKTVEMFNTTVFMAAGSTFHPPKLNKFDFFLIHQINSAPFFLTTNSQQWIPAEIKVRLLEWKIRLDILQYAARDVPDLLLARIKAYKPENPAAASVTEIVSKFHLRFDDGHAVKLARSAAICQDISKQYEDREWLVIKGDDTWMRIHHLILDSVESPGPTWVRGAGLDEAWKDIPDQPKL